MSVIILAAEDHIVGGEILLFPIVNSLPMDQIVDGQILMAPAPSGFGVNEEIYFLDED